METRLTKISDYESSVMTKIYGYVEKFRKYLLVILEKKVARYECVLDFVYDRHRKCLQSFQCDFLMSS